MALALKLPTDELAADDRGKFELTILMPCLNEAETICRCINKARSFLERSGISGEVLIADNGSTDGSVELALAAGARVVPAAERGYGAALQTGIAAARGTYVIMGDADDSYDFSRLDQFVARLREGCDLVMGNRFRGGIAPSAMPFLHRYVGNPALSLVGRRFFHANIGDFHCGLRGFRRDRILALGLNTTGMEFASEMVARAALNRLAIDEVPTTLDVDGRSRRPHLRTWHDGWRHLRFLLMFSPRWLFLYPGLALILLGLAGTIALFPGELALSDHLVIGGNTFLVAAVAVLVGVQIVGFGIIARHFATTHGILPPSQHLTRLLSKLSLERELLTALGIILVGLAGMGWSLWQWAAIDFGPITTSIIMRVLTLSLMLVAVGVQTAFMCFLLGIIDMPMRRTN
jgi:glycosyltransferase involved in cell wall biosynthesis